MFSTTPNVGKSEVEESGDKPHPLSTTHLRGDKLFHAVFGLECIHCNLLLAKALPTEVSVLCTFCTSACLMIVLYLELIVLFVNSELSLLFLSVDIQAR